MSTPGSRTGRPRKLSTGIEGFDEITGGGLPSGRTTLVLGAPGCGKTIFALQTLVNGVSKWDEPGIFVALEENSRQIIENASSMTWFPDTIDSNKLFFLDAQISPDIVHSGEFDLIGLLTVIKAKVDQMGAKRIVFDSIDVVLALMNNLQTERHELYRLHEWLSSSGLTGIITTRADTETAPLSDRYSFAQFMADCVVMLHHRVQDHMSLRELRVLKYRGSSFSENEFPMAISRRGIEVAGTSLQELEFPVYTERISTGVDRLNEMLTGGYYRGTAVLVTGAPGTAKSTLCAAFLEAACLRGERALYVSFDEGINEITRNMQSINVQLQPHIDSGLLRVYSSQASMQGAEEHLAALRSVIDEHHPRCMVVDPVSAMLKSGGILEASAVIQRLIQLAKQQGITFMSSSLLDGTGLNVEGTPIEVSTIADTWIHLSYIVQGGERNRALTIVKSRGTQHSNQVRELILGSQGITLTDVYTAGGEVLMGTLRHERETAERRDRERLRAEIELKRNQLQQTESELAMRIETLRRELSFNQEVLQSLEREQQAYEKNWAEGEDDVRRLRSGDNDTPEAEGATE